MIKLTFFALLLPTLALGNLVNVKSLNVDFDGTIGQLYLANISLEDPKFNFVQKDLDYDLTRSKEDFIVENATSLIRFKEIQNTIFETIGKLFIRNLNLQGGDGKEVLLSFSQVIFQAGDGNQKAESFQVSCQKSASNKDSGIFSFLRPCLDQANLNLSRFEFAEESKSSVSKALDAREIEASSLIADKLESIHFNIQNRKFNASAKFRLLFKHTIKMYGEINFLDESSELHIRLDKVKVGFIGLTKKVLKELREAGFENFRVNGNNIYIKI